MSGPSVALYTPAADRPPSLYGFIPRTYCGRRVGALSPRAKRGDGDPLDVCVISERPINRSEMFPSGRRRPGSPAGRAGPACSRRRRRRGRRRVLARYVLDRLGWREQDLRAFRFTMAFPPIPTVAIMLSERPVRSRRG